MKIIGLDLSLTSTGFSIDGATGIIASKNKGSSRLSEITKKILDLCINNNIDLAVIESYSFASRNSQAHSIGELGGCVRMTLWDNGIPYIDVPPTCRAKFATGKGNASKNEVISHISAKMGMVWQNPGADEQCDAWILEQMAKTKCGLSEISWPAANIDALNKVDWSPIT